MANFIETVEVYRQFTWEEEFKKREKLLNAIEKNPTFVGFYVEVFDPQEYVQRCGMFPFKMNGEFPLINLKAKVRGLTMKELLEHVSLEEAVAFGFRISKEQFRSAKDYETACNKAEKRRVLEEQLSKKTKRISELETELKLLRSQVEVLKMEIENI